jgi:hypothetical protein
VAVDVAGYTATDKLVPVSVSVAVGNVPSGVVSIAADNAVALLLFSLLLLFVAVAVDAGPTIDIAVR